MPVTVLTNSRLMPDDSTDKPQAPASGGPSGHRHDLRVISFGGGVQSTCLPEWLTWFNMPLAEAIGEANEMLPGPDDLDDTGSCFT